MDEQQQTPQAPERRLGRCAQCGLAVVIVARPVPAIIRVCTHDTAGVTVDLQATVHGSASMRG